MAKVKISRIYQFEKPFVICDTNVWYQIINGKFIKPEDVLVESICILGFSDGNHTL